MVLRRVTISLFLNDLLVLASFELEATCDLRT
jgi:hypothetical protein